MLRSLLAIALLFLVGFALVGLTFSASALGRADFTFVNHTEPKTLDPGAMQGEPEGRVADAIFEGLTRLDARTMEPVPGVAERWEIDPDGKRYVFHLRRDARWTDGRKLTAHDFTYAWRRLQEPSFASEYAYILHMVRFAEAYNTYAAQADALQGKTATAAATLRKQHPVRLPSAAFRDFVSEHHLFASLKGTPDVWLQELLASPKVELDAAGLTRLETALRAEGQRRKQASAEARARFGVDGGIFARDDHTLVVELKAPTPYFLELTAFYPAFPVPRWVVEAKGSENDWFLPGKIVTNGPFRLVTWRVGDRIRLERNPTYWGRAEVKLRTIDVLSTENSTTALNLYLSGAVDWLPKAIPDELQQHLRSRPDFYAGPALVVYYYRINTTRKPFNDVRVRKALNLAIDREQIATQVLGMGQLPAYRLVPPGLPDYRPPEPGLRKDVTEARRLLAEAGFPEGRGFPPFGILYNTYEAHKKIADVVADQLRRNLGIQATAYNQEWQSYQASTRALNYDLGRAGWVGDYEDPNTFLDLWVTNGGNNQTGWGDPVYDRLLQAGADVESFLQAPSALLGSMPERAAAERLISAVNQAASGGERLKQAALLRLELLRQAEGLLLDRGLPVIPVYFYVNVGLVKPHVVGFYSKLTAPDGTLRPNPQDRHPLRDLRIHDRQ